MVSSSYFIRSLKRVFGIAFLIKLSDNCVWQNLNNQITVFGNLLKRSDYLRFLVQKKHAEARSLKTQFCKRNNLFQKRNPKHPLKPSFVASTYSK